MSASDNTTYKIQRDSLSVIPNKYWYKLTYQPLMESLTVRFDLSNGETELRAKDFVYNYETIETDCVLNEEDFKVYTLVDKDTSAYIDNGINYIPVTSQESHIFGKCLIGTSIKRDKQLIKITEKNYENYIDELVGYSFIDFSISNQIKDVVNSSSSDCDQVDISYFYQVLED